MLCAHATPRINMPLWRVGGEGRAIYPREESAAWIGLGTAQRRVHMEGAPARVMYALAAHAARRCRHYHFLRSPDTPANQPASQPTSQTVGLDFHSNPPFLPSSSLRFLMLEFRVSVCVYNRPA